MTERPEGTDRPDEPDRVVVRDKRRIDPVTGAARTPAPADTGSRPSTPSTPSTPSAPSTPDEGAADVAAEVAALRDDVAERTADLQRVQAEYANYRKRAERDRLAAGEVAISRVLTEMLPVLDDIDRARQHGDLTGALKAVADHLDSIFSKLGLQAFGEVGDPFDPAIHEAVLHTESDDVSEPTCTTVMRQGYRHGERLLRPAMVGVSEPATPTDDADPDVVDEP